MSDKKKRITYSRKFKREFLKGHENDTENKKFYEYCQENNIRCSTAKAWYTQLNIIPPITKTLFNLGDNEGGMN